MINYLYLLLLCILIPMVLSFISHSFTFGPLFSLFYYLKLFHIICDLLLVFSSLVHTSIRVPPNFHLGVLL